MGYLELEPVPITDVWDAVGQKIILNIIPRDKSESGMLKTDEMRKVYGTLHAVDQTSKDRTVFVFDASYYIAVYDVDDVWEIWKKTPVPVKRPSRPTP